MLPNQLVNMLIKLDAKIRKHCLEEEANEDVKFVEKLQRSLALFRKVDLRPLEIVKRLSVSCLFASQIQRL